MQYLDLSIVQFFNHLGSPWIDALTILVSNEIFLVLVWMAIMMTVVWYDKNQGRKVTYTVLVALSLHFLISEALIKYALSEYIFRVRPYLVDPSIIPLGKRYIDSSIPSSHMASTVAMLFVYFQYYKKYWPAMLGFIVLMAFSRLHNGMHYPSDIISGIILGTIYGAIALCVGRRLCKNQSTS
jgi:undecaprenyl-diphosphatase